MNKWKQLLMLTAVLLLGAIIASFLWPAGSSHDADAGVAAYLQSSSEVTVTTLGEWLTFEPADGTPSVGFIFLPGGNVDYQAYAPTLFEIAAQGFLVVDVPMPLDLAIMGYGKAADVIAAHPEIADWVIGGHSLGGAMAARFVYENPSAVEGLVLWAAYPAESNDLSNLNVGVISISGTLDGLSTPEKIAASIPLLPPDTAFVAIEGGNHAQFGFYGEQKGDNTAQISREAQQAQIVGATAGFLAQFELP